MTGTALDIKEMRQELMATYLNVTLALQIRAMRELREWSQDELAKALGTSQAVISGWEQVRWKNWPQLTTLLEIARVFDVALVVRFSPWSEQISEFMCWPGVSERLSSSALKVPSWQEEYQKLAEEMNAPASSPQTSRDATPADSIEGEGR